MIRFSKFLAELGDEVCRADYISLRLQENYTREMAAHEAPVPGEGYLRFMAADEIGMKLHLKKRPVGFWQKLIDRIFMRGEREVYVLCSATEAEVSLDVTFRRPASSPLLGQKHELSKAYAKGQPLEKDWETKVYVAD
jgi:hypothetical protein